MSRYIDEDKANDFIKRSDAIDTMRRFNGYFDDDTITRFEIALTNHIQAADIVEAIPRNDRFNNLIGELLEIEVREDKVNKICEKLAELFDTPCNYSPCDEIMLESERCIEDCGNISDAECWKRYFEVVYDGERREA